MSHKLNENPVSTSKLELWTGAVCSRYEETSFAPDSFYLETKPVDQEAVKGMFSNVHAEATDIIEEDIIN